MSMQASTRPKMPVLSFAARLRVSEEVSAALAAGRALVALESSIICHGMDYPSNLETAHACEAAVRAAGAVPATVAVLDGALLVGVTPAELRRLAELARDRAASAVRKIARRDIAKAVHDRASGGTTVSATLTLAALAGVPVFATGGVGGVHRGVAESWDISADVAALAATPVLLVCAGVKTILDVPKTLEALESSSVPVVTLRPEDGQFPAFYTRKSGVRSPDAVESEEEAAGAAAVQLEMGAAGMLLAVPIPSRFEADPAVIAAALETATQEKEEQGISGRETTPFLLARIAELTRDHSLRANMHLAENNAATAARIAVLIARRRQCTPAAASVNVVIAGGCAVDITAAPDAGAPLRRGTSNPGTVSLDVGGVGHNVASAAQATGTRALLVSAVGDDALGRVVLGRTREEGLADGIAILPGAATATYCAVNREDGDLETAVADMHILEKPLPALQNKASGLHAALATAKILCIDANLNAQDIFNLTALVQRRHDVRVWFEPVSVAKCVRVLEVSGSFEALDFMSPNAIELASMWRYAVAKQRPASYSVSPSLDFMAKDLLLLHRQRGGQSLCIVCTLGAKGLVLYTLGDSAAEGQMLSRVHVPAAPVPGGVIASTSGAGDALAGSMIGRLSQGDSLESSAKVAVVAAAACCARKAPALLRSKL